LAQCVTHDHFSSLSPGEVDEALSVRLTLDNPSLKSERSKTRVRVRVWVRAKGCANAFVVASCASKRESRSRKARRFCSRHTGECDEVPS
jgi:hypothetical protein